MTAAAAEVRTAQKRILNFYKAQNLSRLINSTHIDYNTSYHLFESLHKFYSFRNDR